MSTTKNPLADFAPKLVEITEKVLFGDVWERPQLSKRDRSLITCAALVALGKTEQMNFHFPRAIENGVTQQELVELITHLAFTQAGPTRCRPARKPRSCSNDEPETGSLKRKDGHEHGRSRNGRFTFHR